MSEKDNLYFIALIPDKDFCEEITEFKKDFAHRFDSKKALKVMPHITLKAPFKLSATEHAGLLYWFKKLYVNKEVFRIELVNFGAFQNIHNPVVFINPVMSLQLYALQKEIIRSFKNSYPSLVHPLDLKFKPHMTIAYRDLEANNFIKAWEEYKVKKYEGSFEVYEFYLLQHDTLKWNIIETYTLK